MKDQKPITPENDQKAPTPDPGVPAATRSQAGNEKSELRVLAEQRLPRSGAGEPRAPKLQPTMQNNVQTRRNRGRLNRDTMKLLGKVLGDYFDHVRQQEVPDHITNLVKEYEARKDKESN